MNKSKLKLSLIKRVNLLKSFFWNRDDKIVLVGAWSGEKFACNSRYIFQYLAENKEKLGLKNVVWVTKSINVRDVLSSMGYEVYMFGSKESIHYHKIAGYHIVCNSEAIDGDIEGLYSYGAKCINLWHGLPLKSFGMVSNEYKDQKGYVNYCRKFWLYLKLKFFGKHIGWDNRYYLSTTRYVTKKLDKCFSVGLDRYIESFYPRNCNAIKLTEEEDIIIKYIKRYNKVFLYLPTFRTENNKFDYTNFADVLNDILKKNNIIWIQKAHSADKQNILNERNDNILSLDPEFDINVLLPHIDFLVTDYSSVMFDAMYHRKPILYLIPDIEEYKKGDRGLNLTNPKDVQTGPVFFSIEELKKYIVYYCNNPDKAYRDDYEKVRNMYWGSCNKNLYDIWIDIIKKFKE